MSSSSPLRCDRWRVLLQFCTRHNAILTSNRLFVHCIRLPEPQCTDAMVDFVCVILYKIESLHRQHARECFRNVRWVNVLGRKCIFVGGLHRNCIDDWLIFVSVYVQEREWEASCRLKGTKTAYRTVRIVVGLLRQPPTSRRLVCWILHSMDRIWCDWQTLHSWNYLLVVRAI